MRKITFLSVLFLLTGWFNTWAQTLVSNVSEQLTDGTIVALQCRDTNGGPNYYFNGKAVKTENLSYSNLFKIRNNEDGTFALQSMLDGTYIGKDGADLAIKATKADAATFTAAIIAADSWTTVVPDTENGTYTVRFTTSGTFLNAQGVSATPKYAAGTGGYSVWYVYTFTPAEAKAMQPFHRFESPRGGYLNANGESGNLQHIANNKEASLWKIDLIDNSDGVKLSNASLPNLYLAGTSSFTEEGATWYVLDNPHRSGYKCISLTSGLTANSCLDASNKGPGIGTWNPTSSDNEGTSWAISIYAPLNDLQDLVNTVEFSYGTDPGFIVQTEEITSAVATAKALIESESSDVEQLDASIAALEEILNTTPRIMPESGKFYMIINALSAFEEQQHVKKAMYSDGSNLIWGSLNEYDRKQVWIITPTEGGYVMQNYADQKYPQPQSTQSSAFVMGTEETVTTLTYLNVAGQFNVKPGGYPAHAGGHRSGAGTGGNVVNYSGGANNCSAWYLHEVEEPTGVVLENVTFNYTVNGVVKKSIIGNYDTANPEAPATYAFVTIGEMTLNSDNTVTVPCTYNLPFTASESYADATWYAVDMHGNNTPSWTWAYEADQENNIKLSNDLSMEDLNSGYVTKNRRWAFVGDPFNGFKIYNKAAGETMTLRKAENGDNTISVMSEIDDRNVFFLYETNDHIEHSFAWKLTDDSSYLNHQDGTLKGWGGNDEGSSCRVYAQTTAIPTKAFYRIKGVANEMYLTTGATGSRMPMIEDGTTAASIFYYDYDKHLLNYASGLYTYKTSETGAVGNSNTWEVIDNGNDQYIFYASAISGGGGRYLYNHNKGTNPQQANRNSGLAGNNTLWTIEPVTELPVTVSAAGYATLFAPTALTIPADVEVYTGTINTEKSAIELSQVEGAIPANTAVLVKAAAGTYNFEIAGEATAVEENALQGTISTAAAPENVYTLQNQNSQVGFYPYTGENINGFKAYITIAADADVQGLTFDFGDATGIEEILSVLETSEKATEIYDLAGRRVAKPVKGIYIKGGKKVIVK